MRQIVRKKVQEGATEFADRITGALRFVGPIVRNWNRVLDAVVQQM